MMMQMMMKMMQMMMGGSASPMMGCMPGMSGMGDSGMNTGNMPCGFTPMASNNIGNFLGMAVDNSQAGEAGPGTDSSPESTPPGLQMSGTQSPPPQPHLQASAPPQPPALPQAPAQAPAQTPAQAPAQAPASPQSPSQAPAQAQTPAPGQQQGKAKTGPPPGYKAMKGKVPSGVVAKAKSLLSQPMGAEIPFEIDGKQYMARLETHYHPPGYKGGPNGYHKGVTVYEKA